MEVHKELGSGFQEAVYQEAWGREFKNQNVPHKAQPVIQIFYKGDPLDKVYHEAQIINYLKATRLKVGLLMNFGSKALEHKRSIHNL